MLVAALALLAFAGLLAWAMRLDRAEPPHYEESHYD